MKTSTPVTFSMIERAKERLRDVAQKTPLITCSSLTDESHCSVYLKMENCQRTGSFKLRGAYNKIASLTEEERSRGIVAASAGNHAQGVALGATVYGAKATICMPSIAPLSKINATKNYGAHVILSGECYDDAYAKAVELVEKEGQVFCHPFNDPEVIAGQGTIALEILEDLPQTDVIIVPIGGGGLIAGVALAAKTINPNIRIIGVQTRNMPSMKLSLDAGEPATVAAKSSIADGIMVKVPGDITFDIVKDYVDDVVLVTEEELSTAILFLLERVKTVAEGAGASPIAALLHHKIEGLSGKKVVAIVSGGNIDINKVGHIINNGLVKSWRKTYLDLILPDKPKELSKLTTIISSTNANILHLHHERSQRDTLFGDVHVTIELETMDQSHAEGLLRLLKAHGYHVIAK